METLLGTNAIGSPCSHAVLRVNDLITLVDIQAFPQVLKGFFGGLEAAVGSPTDQLDSDLIEHLLNPLIHDQLHVDQA